MNFLQEVVTANKTVTIESINKSLPQIEADASRLKQKITKYIEDIYIKFNNHPQRIANLLGDTTILTGKASKLKEEVESIIKSDLDNTKKVISRYNENLIEVDEYLTICTKLCQIHEAIYNLNKLKEDKKYYEFMSEVISVNKAIEQLPDNVNQTLKEKVCIEKGTMLLQLEKIFRENIHFDIKGDDDQLSVNIQIKAKNAEMQSAFKAIALAEAAEDIKVVRKLIRFLWDNVFSEIVHHSTKLNIECINEFTKLSLIINKKQKDNYTIIMNSLKVLANYLQTNLDYDYEEEKNFLEYIGDQIRDNLSELIIKFCLEDTIPSSEEELKEYDKVQLLIASLQDSLVEAQIFPKEMTSLLDHAENVNVLFINRKCKEFLSRGTELMKKDLHDVVVVGTLVDPTKLPTDDFPQCTISKNVPEILDLVKKVLMQAVKSPEECAGRLYVAAVNILSQYPTKVIEHHSKLLQTIPQQIAIFYNNCMYIKYDLESNAKWQELLSNLPKIIEINQLELFTIAKTMKANASQMFDNYLQEQIKLIEATIKESGVGALQTLSKLDQSVEKAVRQCLRQQELLKTVWQKVLNYYDYNKTIGLLLNALCKALINAVLFIEDILTEAGEQLIDVLKVVQMRGPKLFTDPKEINMYVECWHKLGELEFVLSSSLININDRWADGKGPLALDFTPDEVRHLIRALFQHSDRRSTILSKIRDL